MTEEKSVLPEETLKTLEALGEVLARIRNRLLREGVITIGPDKKVIFPKYEERKRSAKKNTKRT